jgi:hypothetical protein
MKMVRMSKEKRAPRECCGYFSVSGGGAAGCRGPAIARRGSGSAGLEAYLPDGTGDEAEAQADSGLRGHVHLGSCGGRVGGKWSDAVARWDEDENESSRVSVERRCGRVPSETRAPRVRERVRTVAEVLNRRHVLRASKCSRRSNIARKIKTGQVSSGQSGTVHFAPVRTTKSTSASSTGRFVSFFRSRVARHALCYISFSSAASPAARRR